MTGLPVPGNLLELNLKGRRRCKGRPRPSRIVSGFRSPYQLEQYPLGLAPACPSGRPNGWPVSKIEAYIMMMALGGISLIKPGHSCWFPGPFL